MNKVDTIEEFKSFLEINRDKIIEKSCKIDDLPPDDEWIMDDTWDELYEQRYPIGRKI